MQPPEASHGRIEGKCAIDAPHPLGGNVKFHLAEFKYVSYKLRISWIGLNAHDKLISQFGNMDCFRLEPQEFGDVLCILTLPHWLVFPRPSMPEWKHEGLPPRSWLAAEVIEQAGQPHLVVGSKEKYIKVHDPGWQ